MFLKWKYQDWISDERCYSNFNWSPWNFRADVKFQEIHIWCDLIEEEKEALH